MTQPALEPPFPGVGAGTAAGTIVHVDAPTEGIATQPATPVVGWVAVDGDGPVAVIGLQNAVGATVPLTGIERPDVASSLPGKRCAGFSGWIDLRTAATGPWTLRFTQAGVPTEAPIPLHAEIALAHAFTEAKRRKLARVRELVRCPRCRTPLEDRNDSLVCASGHAFPRRPDAFDFLDDAVRAKIGAVPTDNVSAHGYDAMLKNLIAGTTGPVLDVGAGLRPEYREDVINLEIVAYPTTDVIAASEYLPFADDTFDLVISVAVLEHVRDPFGAARELQRVVRPGGRIFAAVPFLQPYHAYPDHYYNMTVDGLRNLFPGLCVEQLDVPQSGGPIYALTWMLQLWRSSLPPETAQRFDQMTMADLMQDPQTLAELAIVRELPAAAIEQLAARNAIVARKPS